MCLKYMNPSSPGNRSRVSINYSYFRFWKKTSSNNNQYFEQVDKELKFGKKNFAGRNHGRISIRGKGNGHKRAQKNILFKRRFFREHFPTSKLQFRFETLSYDPNRTAFLSLVSVRFKFLTIAEKYLFYQDACFSVKPFFDSDSKKQGLVVFFFILAPKEIKIGDVFYENIRKNTFTEDLNLLPGKALPVEHIPFGTLIHNLEIVRNFGGQLIRAAGVSGQILDRCFELQKVKIRLPSGQIRWVNFGSFATIGTMSNTSYRNIVIAKAGRSRWLSKRPKVRGVAMNPVDHPHGGGEGKTSGGRPSVTPWGRPAKNSGLKKNILFKLNEKNKIR